MKISIFGQRKVTEDKVGIIQEALDKALFDLPGENIVFLTGGATGVQEIAYQYIKDDYDFVVFKPWTQISKTIEDLAMSSGRFDPIFFFYRNIQIVDNSDLVIVFDTGDKDAEVYKVLDLCHRKGKALKVVKI